MSTFVEAAEFEDNGFAMFATQGCGLDEERYEQFVVAVDHRKAEEVTGAQIKVVCLAAFNKDETLFTQVLFSPRLARQLAAAMMNAADEID